MGSAYPQERRGQYTYLVIISKIPPSSLVVKALLTLIGDDLEVHITEKSTERTTTTPLKWVHSAISNAKGTVMGIYHKIKGTYLQNSLDEFCYKLN